MIVIHEYIQSLTFSHIIIGVYVQR